MTEETETTNDTEDTKAPESSYKVDDLTEKQWIRETALRYAIDLAVAHKADSNDGNLVNVAYTFEQYMLGNYGEVLKQNRELLAKQQQEAIAKQQA